MTGELSNPCGTDPEELAEIIALRQAALNKLKADSKKRTRRGDSKVEGEERRGKRRQTE